MGTSRKGLLLLSKAVAMRSEVKLGETTVTGFAVRTMLTPVPVPTRTPSSRVAVTPVPEEAVIVAAPARPLLRSFARAMPLDVETRSSITPTVVVKKIWVPSATVPPPSSTDLKAITVIVDSPLIRGIAVGLALIERVAPSGEIRGTSPPQPDATRASPTTTPSPRDQGPAPAAFSLVRM